MKGSVSDGSGDAESRSFDDAADLLPPVVYTAKPPGHRGYDISSLDSYRWTSTHGGSL